MYLLKALKSSLKSKSRKLLRSRNIWLRRYPNVQVAPRIEGSDFLNTPIDFQKEQLVQTRLNELDYGLKSADRLSRRFVNGTARPPVKSEWRTSAAQFSDSQLVIDSQQVMQDWERPLMHAMADIVADTGGDILEVGFGMAISASRIQERGVRSHTIVELNDEVVTQFQQWKQLQPSKDIRLIQGRWQDVVDQLSTYDGVFFDAYNIDARDVEESVYIVEAFIPVAARVLRKGGVFTFFTAEIESLPREHQERLLEHFESITMQLVRGLEPPPDCHYWWSDTMVLVKATK